MGAVLFARSVITGVLSTPSWMDGGMESPGNSGICQVPVPFFLHEGEGGMREIRAVWPSAARYVVPG